MDVPIDGWCAPGFEAVDDAFRTNFAERGEVGAALCVQVGDEVVVDLVGGWAGVPGTGEPGRAWAPATLVDVYSVGKAILGTLLLREVDAGRVDLHDPVASVWPEFGAAGKERATIAHALSHQAGVPAIRRLLTDEDLFDWSTMTAALAATEPWWEPGTQHGYHTNTFGHLVGELVRRVSGRGPGAALRAVAEPLGADLWFGVPEVEQARCATVVWAPGEGQMPDTIPFDRLEGPVLCNALAHFNPPGYSSVGWVNTPRWRALELGSTAGHGTARGVARWYAALLEPGRLLSPDLLAEATRPWAEGPCPILGDDVAFGLGFAPTTPRRPFGPNPRSFGHFGTGGSLGFADPTAEVALGYVMNHVRPRWQSPRNQALVQALYGCL